MTATIDFTVDATGTQGSSAQSLVASAYRRTLAPNAAGAIQPDDVITFLDEEMRSTIVPLVLAAQEEFWVKNFDQAIVAGTYNYTIPPRAAFATWRDVVFVDTNGMEINLTDLAPEYLKLTFPAGGNPPLYVFGFVLVNDQVVLWPPNSGVPTQYLLRMKIKRRPNNLTSSDNCGQITAINTGTFVVTLDNADTSWTTATTFDIIPNSPQFTSRQDDQTVSAVSLPAGGPYTLTFSSPGTNPVTGVALPRLPVGLTVGDWVCPSMVSCVPQIPYDMFPLLAQRGAIKILEALGDTQNLTIAERRYQDMAVDFARTVSPRIDGTPKKIVNRNLGSWWGSGFGFPFCR
jgi:hypothetical protein